MFRSTVSNFCMHAWGSCVDLHVCSIYLNMCILRSHHIPCTQPVSSLAFALQLSELDETLERLDIRCNRFMKGSKRYKEGINALSQSQNSFADFLEEFCGGTDEESMILGNELRLLEYMCAGIPSVHTMRCIHLTHQGAVLPSCHHPRSSVSAMILRQHDGILLCTDFTESSWPGLSYYCNHSISV